MPLRRNLYGAIMETMRESWADERLDDFVAHAAALIVLIATQL